MSDQGFTSYSLANDKAFLEKLNEVLAVSDDLRVPFGLISMDFYKSQRAVFSLGSQGKYPDLADRTKKYKLAKYGFIYPILFAKGKLANSLLGPRNYGSYNIITKRGLTLGTTIDYAIFHQSDRARKKIPLRKFLFIGPESTLANDEQKGRPKRWLAILDDHFRRAIKQKGFSK